MKPKITLDTTGWGDAELREAERMAEHMGYRSWGYTSSSDLGPCLSCHARTDPGEDHNLAPGHIILTHEFGFLFIQDMEDVGTTPQWERPAPPPVPDTPGQKMVDHWALHFDTRCAITEFWDWLTEEKMPALRAANNDDRILFMDLHVEKLLDEYHQINRKDLDDGRRAILDAHRQATGQE